MSKHTPGPWTHMDGCDATAVVHAGEDRTFVADCNGMNNDDAVDLANAQLIAAAPDLLAALRDIDRTYSDSSHADMYAVAGDIVAIARAAIAKAALS